jgi:hypothetical protein
LVDPVPPVEPVEPVELPAAEFVNEFELGKPGANGLT